MLQDLLNLIDENEDNDDIPYDLVYDDCVKIPTRSTDAQQQDKNTTHLTNNNTNSCVVCINDTCNCVTGFYHHSKYFTLFLCFTIAVIIGALYFIIFISTHTE